MGPDRNVIELRGEKYNFQVPFFYIISVVLFLSSLLIHFIFVNNCIKSNYEFRLLPKVQETGFDPETQGFRMGISESSFIYKTRIHPKENSEHH